MVPAIKSASFSHTGLVRDGNEDRILITDSLFVVCDGLGGHAGGEVAAQMAVDVLRDDAPKDAESLAQSVAHANEVVFEVGMQDAALHGMGTTIVAMLLLPGRVVVAHVGDSRAYAVSMRERDRNVTLHRLTVDHEHNGRLTDAVGCDRHVRVAMRAWTIEPGDVILLCSDGLYRDVEDAKIARRLGSDRTCAEIADSLLGAALDGGGHDNISGIVVRF